MGEDEALEQVLQETQWMLERMKETLRGYMILGIGLEIIEEYISERNNKQS